VYATLKSMKALFKSSSLLDSGTKWNALNSQRMNMFQNFII